MVLVMVAKSLNEKYLTFASLRTGIAAGQKERETHTTVITVLRVFFISIN